MKIQSVAIADLVFDPANARKHEAKNLDAIKGSLARFGQQKPIVVGSKGVIIAGNGTLAAARSLGWEKIDVVYTDLTGTDATAFAIADNRTSELAEWDAGVLSETLKSLQEMDFDLGSIGFDADDLAALIATPEPPEGLTDPDAVPENVETRCKPGDLWVLGTHRLLCGDSTNVQHVERLMGGEKADMVFTDPPYGIDFQSNHRKKTPQFDRLANDDVILDIGPVLWAVMADNSAAYICTRWDVYPKWIEQLASFSLKNCVVWFKRGGGLGDLKNAYSPNHEFIIVAHKGTSPLRGKRRPDVWEIGRDNVSEYAHPTQKPVDLSAFAIDSHSDRDSRVLDLFLGSGSTLIACHKTQRRCFGMEIDPKYCDVILARWEAFTGKVATLSAGNSEG